MIQIGLTKSDFGTVCQLLVLIQYFLCREDLTVLHIVQEKKKDFAVKSWLNIKDGELGDPKHTWRILCWLHSVKVVCLDH